MQEACTHTFTRSVPVQLPVGLPESGPSSEQTIVAYDGMRLPLSLLMAAPKILTAISLAFAK